MSNITKKAMEASLKKLLLKKPLSKITINDITEDCGVNRMTFYYHFKDIYDLIEWMLTQDAEKLIRNRQNNENWEQALVEIFNAVLENKVIILNLYHSVNHEQVENYLNKPIYSILRDVINEKSQQEGVSEEDKKFIADFYKYAITGVILNWVKNDMKIQPEIISKKLVTLIKRNIEGDLEDFKEQSLSKTL